MARPSKTDLPTSTFTSLSLRLRSRSRFRSSSSSNSIGVDVGISSSFSALALHLGLELYACCICTPSVFSHAQADKHSTLLSSQSRLTFPRNVPVPVSPSPLPLPFLTSSIRISYLPPTPTFSLSTSPTRPSFLLQRHYSISRPKSNFCPNQRDNFLIACAAA